MGSCYGSSSSKLSNSKLCGCKEPPILRIAQKKNENYGRRFLGCQNYKNQNCRGCGFFEWVEDDGEEKKSIRESLEEIKALLIERNPINIHDGEGIAKEDHVTLSKLSLKIDKLEAKMKNFEKKEKWDNFWKYFAVTCLIVLLVFGIK